MLFQTGDTIAALASAPGAARRGIVRISGPRSLEIVEQCLVACDTSFSTIRHPRRVDARFVFSGHLGQLPVACHCWPDARSFTGEPCVEIHTLGSPPLLEGILSRLFQAGARAAQRGEFTFRAFLAGKIDLVQAEALLGVIESQDADELRVALKQLAGGISSELDQVRGILLNLLADLEAELDFSDEGLEFVPRDLLRTRLQEVRTHLERIRSHAQTRHLERLRKRVIIIGPANVGKSTLFNALCGDRKAIVSDLPGTTRDYLSADLTWEGVDLELIDAAGDEAAPEEIVRMSLDLRNELMREVDLKLYCRLFSSPLHSEPDGNSSGSRGDVIDVLTQADRIAVPHTPNANAIVVSAQTGMGMQDLRSLIAQRLKRQGHTGELIGSTAARCKESLDSARNSISRAENHLSTGRGNELLADDLRMALNSLGEITGAWTSEDLLDRIFSRFCIGK